MFSFTHLTKASCSDGMVFPFCSALCIVAYCVGYLSWTARNVIPANAPNVKFGSYPPLPDALLAAAAELAVPVSERTSPVAAARRKATGTGGGGDVNTLVPNFGGDAAFAFTTWLGVGVSPCFAVTQA